MVLFSFVRETFSDFTGRRACDVHREASEAESKAFKDYDELRQEHELLQRGSHWDVERELQEAWHKMKSAEREWRAAGKRETVIAEQCKAIRESTTEQCPHCTNY